MMSHPFVHARINPDRTAVRILESQEILTYRDLEHLANQDAHLLRGLGLQRGDCVAAILDNGTAMFRIAWAAQRAGLYFCAISTRLTEEEAEYIIRDSQARALFTSRATSAGAAGLNQRLADLPTFLVDASESDRDWFGEARSLPATPIADESAGEIMLYSSGTTGRPKGIKRPLPESGLLAAPPIMPLLTQIYGATEQSIYLCPAPLYHAAPLGWTMAAHRLGCTVIVMEKFDAEAALACIQNHQVTHAQFVPTHFVRMLKLPPEVRARYDVSSLQTVWHAAAPCPVPVKEAMLSWFGPIVHEYYAATEANGVTAIGPDEWRERPGSVGRAIGCEVWACDDDGEPVERGAEGQIYFSGGQTFEYHNDPAKTAASRNARGWTTLGDIGRIDRDGYLFLTDRKSFMIISGGVNIYPQEIENLLVLHPKIADAAVIGIPDDDMGERVVAVIQAVDPQSAGAELASEIDAWLRPQLSGVKRPRQIDFVAELPRHPTGKLYKRLIRDRYIAAAD